MSLLNQWHPNKNEPLTPKDLTYGSKQKVWWKCENGHEWQTPVFARTSGGAGCPYCSGRRAWSGENDLKSQRPDIAEQWHPTKNGALLPEDVSWGSRKVVWWQCEKGHEWRARVETRVAGSGCPVCTKRVIIPGVNDLGTTHPELIRQWDPNKNGSLTAQKVAAGTHRKVWWKCEKGHEWQASVLARTQGSDCPVCAGKIVVPGENDLASRFPNVAAQWCKEKNLPLHSDEVSAYSNRKAWWCCPLGHEYTAEISARTMKASGCPYCAGKKVLLGFNDLATIEPQVAEQWHPVLNGTLTAQMVTTGSHQKVWWQCAEGHVWKAVIHSRAGPEKCGCPVCAGRVNAAKQSRYAAALAEQLPSPGVRWLRGVENKAAQDRIL